MVLKALEKSKTNTSLLSSMRLCVLFCAFFYGYIYIYTVYIFCLRKSSGSTCPFAMAHQMMDTAGRWLPPDERSSRQLLEEVVWEGFILALPPSTAEWVMCYSPASLDEVINLAEDHLALPPQTRGEGGQAPSLHLRHGPVPWRPPSGSRAGPPGGAGSPSPSQNRFPPRRTNLAYRSEPVSALDQGPP